MRPPARGVRLAAAAAWVVPLGLALWRTSSHAQWRSDVSALRDLALVPMGGLGGGLSGVLAQVAGALPLGTQTFRSALVSVLALAAAGWFLQRMALCFLRALDQADGASSDAPWLATMASLLATLSPAFQEEGTVGGSTMLAVALALAALDQCVGLLAGRASERPMAGLVFAAACTGAAISERPATGLAALLGLAVMVVVLRLGLSRGPRVMLPARVVGTAALTLLAAGCLVALPNLLRNFAQTPALPLGGQFYALAAGSEFSLQDSLWVSLSQDFGIFAVGLSALGSVVLLLHPRARSTFVGMCAIVLTDLALRTKLGATESMLGLRMLALGCLACASTSGLFFATRFLAAMRVPMARAAAAMSVAFYATLVVLVAEQSGERADRQSDHGAEQLTDLALEGLPPSAAVLVSSPTLTWRLFAAQLVEGRRRDVLIMAPQLLDRGAVARDLLSREPAVEPLLRATALMGHADEASLARLADARWLLLQYERGFETTTSRHLSPSGVWLQFQTDPPSRGDRRRDNQAVYDRLEAEVVSLGRDPSLATASVFRNLVRGQAKLLLRHGELGAAERHLRGLQIGDATTTLERDGSLDVLFLGAVARLPVVEKLHKNQDRADNSKGSRKR